MGNVPSISGQDSGRSHVPGDHSEVVNIKREQRPEQLQIPDTDNEEEVDNRRSSEMEVPDSRLGYNFTLLPSRSVTVFLLLPKHLLT